LSAVECSPARGRIGGHQRSRVVAVDAEHRRAGRCQYEGQGRARPGRKSHRVPKW
jgi:hypothetical protein